MDQLFRTLPVYPGKMRLQTHLQAVLVILLLSLVLPAFCQERAPTNWELIFEQKFEKGFLQNYKPGHWMQDHLPYRIDIVTRNGKIDWWKIVDVAGNKNLETAVDRTLKNIKGDPELLMTPIGGEKRKTILLKRLFTSSSEIMLFDTGLFRCTVRDAEEVPITWKIGEDIDVAGYK